MDATFIDRECCWTTPASGPGPCAGCGALDAQASFHAVRAELSPDDPPFCTPRCWGRHLDATARETPPPPCHEPRMLGTPPSPWSDMLIRYGRRCPPGPGCHVVRALQPPRHLILYRDTSDILCCIVLQSHRQRGRGSVGCLSVWTAPTHEHRGIARRVLREAVRRWGYDRTAQWYTEAGLGLTRKAGREAPARTQV